MRRATLAILLGLSFASYALPQESGQPAESKHEAEEGDPWLWWKWANFALLAGGLGYLVWKHAPGFFAARSQQIGQGMLDAAKVKQDAEAKAAGVEQRLSGLQGEIEKMRLAARAEVTAEGERISRETDQHLQKIQSQAAQEIVLMTRAGRDELRKYSARLALDLAEQQIRSRMTKDAQDNLLDGFLHDLHRGATPNGTRT